MRQSPSPGKTPIQGIKQRGYPQQGRWLKKRIKTTWCHYIKKKFKKIFSSVFWYLKQSKTLKLKGAIFENCKLVGQIKWYISKKVIFWFFAVFFSFQNLCLLFSVRFNLKEKIKVINLLRPARTRQTKFKLNTAEIQIHWTFKIRKHLMLGLHSNLYMVFDTMDVVYDKLWIWITCIAVGIQIPRYIHNIHSNPTHAFAKIITIWSMIY